MAAVQFFNPLDADMAAAMAFDLCAHLDQHLGQVRNLGLLGGVFKNGFTVGQTGGHQEIFSAGDRHHVGGDAGTLQTRLALGQARNHVAVFDRDLCTHRHQALDVLIDRA